MAGAAFGDDQKGEAVGQAALYRSQAENGDPEAQFRLGIMYLHGQLVPKDVKQAEEWLRKAADQGHAYAQTNLGAIYSGGWGVPQDYKQSAEWHRKAADQGVSDAAYRLGLIYAEGKGVPQDYKQASEWYHKAADKGIAPAQHNLGLMYANGLGVPQDKKQALEWFLKAADKGHTDAQFNLGYMYAEGIGVPQDYKMAAEWYRKAADQGSAPAQYSLGASYIAGRGVPQNVKESFKWYLQAANKGHLTAQAQVGAAYLTGIGVTPDYAQAMKWSRLAAERRHPDALRTLAAIYLSDRSEPPDRVVVALALVGLSAAIDPEKKPDPLLSSSELLPTNLKEAAIVLQSEMTKPGNPLKALDAYVSNMRTKQALKDKAELATLEEQRKIDAAQNNPKGMYDLGRSYDAGSKAPDIYKAIQWYRKASALGSADAQYRLGTLNAQGYSSPTRNRPGTLGGHGRQTEVMPNEKEAVKWYRLAAEQGMAAAQSSLGEAYAKGKGVVWDDREAVKWYRMVVDAHGVGHLQLGDLYADDHSAVRDYGEAVKWYMAAEKNPSIFSVQYKLGVMYEEGKGVAQDYAEAARWFGRARVDEKASFMLGVLYHRGQGVPRDDLEAIKWFSKPGVGTNVLCISHYNIGVMYANGLDVKQDYAEAVKWYTKPLLGCSLTHGVLGIMYANGLGVAQDYGKALMHLRNAADDGLPEAQFNLGVMYMEGLGVRQDKVVGYALFSLALADDTLVGDVRALAIRAAAKVAMTDLEIGASERLTRELGKPGNLRKGLDGYMGGAKEVDAPASVLAKGVALGFMPKDIAGAPERAVMDRRHSISRRAFFQEMQDGDAVLAAHVNARYHADADGRISLEEWLTFHRKRLTSWDTDSDGSLSQNEYYRGCLEDQAYEASVTKSLIKAKTPYSTFRDGPYTLADAAVAMAPSNCNTTVGRLMTWGDVQTGKVTLAQAEEAYKFMFEIADPDRRGHPVGKMLSGIAFYDRRVAELRDLLRAP